MNYTFLRYPKSKSCRIEAHSFISGSENLCDTTQGRGQTGDRGSKCFTKIYLALAAVVDLTYNVFFGRISSVKTDFDCWRTQHKDGKIAL